MTKLSEINGWDDVGPKKANPATERDDFDMINEAAKEGHNSCLSSIESLDVGMDREELVKVMWEFDKDVKGFKTFHELAEAIIANEAKILRIARRKQ